MHVIAQKRLRLFWQEHPEAEVDLRAWYRIVEQAHWFRWADVQRAFPKASVFQCCLVFDICGNQYRLVTRRAANWKTLFVVGVFRHADYDRGEWKKRCRKTDRKARG